MISEIVVLQGAEADILEGYIRYERSGRESEFYETVDEKLAQIRAFPESGGIFAAQYRRIILDDFPYGIFYTISGTRLFVVTVSDLRVDPRRILERLRM